VKENPLKTRLATANRSLISISVTHKIGHSVVEPVKNFASSTLTPRKIWLRCVQPCGCRSPKNCSVPRLRYASETSPFTTHVAILNLVPLRQTLWGFPKSFWTLWPRLLVMGARLISFSHRSPHVVTIPNSDDLAPTTWAQIGHSQKFVTLGPRPLASDRGWSRSDTRLHYVYYRAQYSRSGSNGNMVWYSRV